jgi:DICT domain-containing protein
MTVMNDMKFTTAGEYMEEDLIMKLAKEAGFKTDWQHEDVQDVKSERYRKFAELIIQEALLELDHYRFATDTIYEQRFVEGYGVARNIVAAHFGVDV